MALRLMQVVVPDDAGPDVPAPLEDARLVARWKTRVGESPANVFQVLTTSRRAERVMDRLHQRYGATEGFSVTLMPVTAADPRYEEPADDESSHRVSRNELYREVLSGTELSRTFIAMTVLSSIVAMVGLLHDDVAVIIGAMVIAPLLGPNVALALANTLADTKLLRQALSTNVVGVTIALVLSIPVGALVDVPVIGAVAGAPELTELAARTRVAPAGVLLALASGAAGTLAFTTGLSATLIGVMVAVALLPPLVTFGMLLGDGQFDAALRALQIVVLNVIGVNLAGVATFWWQGVRPREWWTESRARRSVRISSMIWIALLATLVWLLLRTPALD